MRAALWWLAFALSAAIVASADDLTLQPAGPQGVIRTENGWSEQCIVVDLGGGLTQLNCPGPRPSAPHAVSVEPVDPDEDMGDEGEGDE